MTPDDQALSAGAAPAQDPNSPAAIERALSTQTDPEAIARDYFRLAQAYHHAGQRERAIESYLKRAELGHSADEVFISLYYAAKLRQELDQPQDQVIAAYLRAADFDPTRAEPLYAVANYCRFRGLNEEGYQHAKRASAIPKPEQGMWIEPWAYDVGVLDELTVNAYWTGRYREAIDSGLKLLVEANLSPGQREHVAQNVRLAGDRLDAQVKSATTKRFIRLKEFAPSGEFSNTPSPTYISERDSSLRQETYKLSTDEHGFIRSHVCAPDTAKKLIVLGDSVVESLFSQPHERFCSRLQDILRNEHGLDVAIQNAGYSGATILHSLNVFLNKIIPLKPAGVIFMSGIVDVDAATMTPSFWTKDALLEPIVTAADTRKARETDFLGRAAFEDRERLLTLLAQAAERFDVPLYFATVAHRQVFEGEYVAKAFRSREDFDRQVAMRRAMNEVTRRCAAAAGRPLIDVERDLAAETGLFYDMFHLNDRGGEAVARALVEDGLPELLRGTECERFGGDRMRSAVRAGRAVTDRELASVLDIQVINLDRSPERMEIFRRRNAHLSRFTRFSAHDGRLIDRAALVVDGVIAQDVSYTAGSIGCALSHAALWKRAVEEGRPITVFEDDVVTARNFEAEVTRGLSSVPEDWDVIQWGYNCDPLFLWADFGPVCATLRFYGHAFGDLKAGIGSDAYQAQMHKLAYSFGLLGYSVSPKGASRLLETCFPLRDRNVPFAGTGIMNQDTGIDVAMNLAYPNLSTYFALPPLVVTDESMVSDRLNT